MPRRDTHHESVKIGLEKVGWRILKEELRLSIGKIDLYVDLEAEAIYVAERAGEKIAVEIKSFSGQSLVQNMHEALGKYRLYKYAIELKRPELTLYLAVPLSVFTSFFQEELIQVTVRQDRINLIVYNAVNQTIESWVTH